MNVTNHRANKVTNLKEFFFALNDLLENSNLKNSKTLWFRGQSDQNWDLLPTVYRNKNLNYFEREMVRDFKILSSEKIERQPRNELEWLFIMQHYGLQTRLIDWTEGHLIALFFAVIDYSYLKDSVVWILRPSYLNRFSLGAKTIVTSSYPELIDYVLDEPHLHLFNRKIKGEMPVAIRATRNSERIVAQKGTFTLHGSNSLPLNKIIDQYNNNNTDKQIPLHYITISGNSKLQILKELYMCGISYSVLFPEIQGICNEIKLKYSDDFNGSMNLNRLL